MDPSFLYCSGFERTLKPWRLVGWSMRGKCCGAALSVDALGWFKHNCGAQSEARRRHFSDWVNMARTVRFLSDHSPSSERRQPFDSQNKAIVVASDSCIGSVFGTAGLGGVGCSMSSGRAWT